MKRQQFNPATIDSLFEGILADPFTKGLSIEVTPGGRKVWKYRRRLTTDAKILSLRLGNYPMHSIAAARSWAAGLNEQIEEGQDPREARRAEEAKMMSLGAAHVLYIEAMVRGDRKTLKPRTLSDKRVIFRRDIAPRLGSKILSGVTEDECWEAVYDRAKTSKVLANKMAGELSCFFRWCAGREGKMAGIDLAGHPAPTLNSNWFATGPKANKRFLSAEELKWLLQALLAEDLTYRRGILLLLLTAARRSELFGAPASEIADGLWTLPAERAKNGEPNYVALSPWGQSLAKTNSNWLFPSPRIDGPQLWGWFRARDRIHARMEELAGGPVPRWHFHDLRRTFRSHARRLGIDKDIAELMLNHKRTGLEGVYDRSEELEMRAQGFAVWEAYLVGLVIELGLQDAWAIPNKSRSDI